MLGGWGLPGLGEAGVNTFTAPTSYEEHNHKYTRTWKTVGYALPTVQCLAWQGQRM
jgi:hypothetical protein